MLMLQVLSGYNLLGTNRIEESYFCGGGINTEISPIYGEIFKLKSIVFHKV